MAVCNDSVGSSNLVGFQKLFPERLVSLGIAEQNMVGVGAGLANAGFIPFVCGAGPFLTSRALEQIKVDVAYNGFPVVPCGMSPGMAYGELGPTHHSIEDLTLTIYSVTVGTHTVSDAHASVMPAGSPMLLGLGVLNAIGKFEVDAPHRTLTFNGGASRDIWTLVRVGRATGIAAPR